MIRPPMSIVALTFGAFALLSCSDDTAPTQPGSVADQPLAPEFAFASNSWQKRAPLPTGRAYHSAGVATNASGESITYLLGGIDTDSRDLSVIEAYNYASNTWTTKTARLLSSRTSGVGVIGNKLYLAGGFIDSGDGPEGHTLLQIYDPTLDVVTRGADMPRPIADGVTGVIGGKLYVLSGSCWNCGSSGVNISQRFYRYDPASNTWAYLPWVPRAHFLGAGGVINGKLYAAGGLDINLNETAALDVYDPATNKWSAKASMPQAIVNAAGAVLNNKLYVMGGAPPPGETSGRTVYMYDPATNSWTSKAPLITARGWFDAVTVTAFGNSKILALGGQGDGGESWTANEVYKP